MRLSEFFPNGKPARVSTLTSGSGTFTPLVTPCWARVTLVGGGAGGYAGNNGTNATAYGGGAGQTIVAWLRLTSSVGYSVAASAAGGAAGGSAGTAGNVSTFGALTAHGGQSASSSLGGGYDSTTGVVFDCGFGGMAGGAGGRVVGQKASGRGPGAPMGSAATTDFVGGGASGTTAGSYLGGSGGGSSMYGMGGAGGNANSSGTGAVGGAGSGYGAGGGGGGYGSSAGGAGGAGAGGLLIIEEWPE